MVLCQQKFLLVACFCLLIAGCFGDGADKRGLPSATTPMYAVGGKILVDGKPVRNLQLGLYDPNRPNGTEYNNPVARGNTEADGTFKMTTFTAYDGAPPGNYTLVVLWLEWGRPTWFGPDKLKNQYADPKDGPFKVVVTDKPQTDLLFECKLEGAEEKPLPDYFKIPSDQNAGKHDE